MINSIHVSVKQINCHRKTKIAINYNKLAKNKEKNKSANIRQKKQRL